MKRIFSSDDRVEIAHLTALLDADGIPYLVKNQNLSGAMGEIPPIECWPEVWIRETSDLPRALTLVEAVTQTTAQDGVQDWKCLCGEDIEGQFSACWNCGRTAPDPVEK